MDDNRHELIIDYTMYVRHNICRWCPQAFFTHGEILEGKILVQISVRKIERPLHELVIDYTESILRICMS